MTICPRIVLRPQRQPPAEIAIETPGVAVVGTWRKHQARKRPLALLLPVGRQLKIGIFHAWELPEGLLVGVERAHENETASQPARCFSPIHPLPYPENTIRASGRLLYCVLEP